MQFKQILMLHDQNDPNGLLEALCLHNILFDAYPTVEILCPSIPGMPTVTVLDYIKQQYMSRIQENALLIGFGRGGLVACVLQDTYPTLNLSVVAINSPTEDGGLELKYKHKLPHLLALYSSDYAPIKNCCDWATITPEAYDVWWLKEDFIFYTLAYLISAFSKGKNMKKEISTVFSFSSMLI